MRWIVCALVLVFSVAAVAESPRYTRPAQVQSHKKSAEAQIKRCQDGVAFACYDYGLTLSMSKNPAKRREGEKYVRRACLLAYAPACKDRANAEVKGKDKDGNPAAETAEKKDTERKPSCVTADTIKAAALTKTGGGQKIGSVEKGSVLEKAGLLPGDVIKSVNGKPVTDPEKLLEMMDSGEGEAEVVIDRQGASVPLSFSCD